MPIRSILVTSALPYANGPIHIGHLVEYIQTDIWVRFQKLQNNECYYICADDAHGTPIMLRAEKENIEPEELIKKIQIEHQHDFATFHIDFDNYYSTHSAENKKLCEEIFKTLTANNYIINKSIKQLYDPIKKIFLPDRFIKGTCPNCKSKHQYGDNCEVCGKTYNPTDLINPYSMVSGAAPVIKETKHFFFNLPQFNNKLIDWLKNSNVVETEVFNKLNQWLTEGLIPWDITRDSPYFGFKIPGQTDKYFYVWLDAPVGYMASFKNLCNRTGLNFNKFWEQDSKTELYHFIGKDIVYFHALFWPAQLMGCNYRLPTKIFTHGFLTVNGKKMSKSRGTFIMAKKFAKYFNPELLRYFFASKLNGSIDDIDLNLDDFVKKINSDLIGKVINIASRSSGFLQQHFASTICDKNLLNKEEIRLYNSFIQIRKKLTDCYEARNTNAAIRLILNLADKTNEYIDQNKPWVLAKTSDKENLQRLHVVASLSLNLFRIIIMYLSPILPVTAKKSMLYLKQDEANWLSCKEPISNHKINDYQPILERLALQNIQKLLSDNKDEIS